MPKKIALGLLAFLGLLAPSIWMAWTYRDIPHLGRMHDDSLYLIGAKSLAEGQGYRIPSLPGEPFQTKYPPLYPAYLALLWKLFPEFPANLSWMMLGAWIWLPLFLAMGFVVLKTVHLRSRDRALVLAFLALNPYSAFLSTNLLTELFGGAILLLAIWAAVRSQTATLHPERWVLLAGLATGAAYLSRSSLAPLYLAIPVGFALHRRWRSIAIFYAVSVPPLIAWTLWAGRHRLVTDEPTLLYYTNYLGLYLRTLSWETLPVMVWKNSSILLASAGQILLPNLLSNDLVINVSRLLGLMCCTGLARLWKRQGFHPLFLFTALYAFQLVIWNYPPDARLVFPASIALLAGFATEARFLGELLVHTWRTKRGGERYFAGALMATCGLMIAISLTQCFHFTFDLLTIPRNLERQSRTERLQAYEWIRKNTPPNARFYAFYDPVLHLYTGRTGLRLTYPERLYYVGTLGDIRDYLFEAKRFADKQKLDYVFLVRSEVLPGSPEQDQADFWRIARDRAAAPPLWQSPNVRILRTFDFPDVALEFQSEQKLARSRTGAPGASASQSR